MLLLGRASRRGVLSGGLDEESFASRLRVARLDVAAAFFCFSSFIRASAVVTDCLKILIYTVPIVLSKVLLFEPRPPFFSFLILPPLRGSNYLLNILAVNRGYRRVRAAVAAKAS